MCRLSEREVQRRLGRYILGNTLSRKPKTPITDRIARSRIVEITKADAEDAVALGVVDKIPESMKEHFQDE